MINYIIDGGGLEEIEKIELEEEIDSAYHLVHKKLNNDKGTYCSKGW